MQKVNYAVWAALSIAIFLCLLFVSNIATKTEENKVSVQQAYDELALALSDAGILPGVGEGEMLSAFARQTFDKGKLRAPSPGSSGTIELNLGTVLTAKFQSNGATFIGLRPGDYKQLVPGELREALKRINRLPYSTQLEELASVAARSFTVTVNPNGTAFTITPGFNSQQCSYLVVN